MPLLQEADCRSLELGGGYVLWWQSWQPKSAMAHTVYIAASFRHMHAVRLLGRELEKLGFIILDWTARAAPPPGLTPAQRRIWMDTDQDGGQVFAFCRNACSEADLVIYYGASGQDAGVEVGLAAASGVPILGIRGPLEAPGLMLHGAATVWVDSIEGALEILSALAAMQDDEDVSDPATALFAAALRARERVDIDQG